MNIWSSNLLYIDITATLLDCLISFNIQNEVEIMSALVVLLYEVCYVCVRIMSCVFAQVVLIQV